MDKKEADRETIKHASGMHTAKGTKSRKPRKKMKSTHIDHVDNDGHVVTHSYSRDSKDGSFMPSEEKKHVFTSGADMVAHMASMFPKKGGKQEAPAEEAPEEAEAEPAEEEEEA